jgi:alpha-mannosidase
MNKLVFGLLFLASQCVAQTPYIKDWLVIGTFPNPDAARRLSDDYLRGESSVAPRGGELADGHQWVIYRSPLDYLNLRNSDLGFAPVEYCVSYAAVFVQSPIQQSVRLLVGSDDAIAVWCNGTRIHFLDTHRSIRLDNDTVAAELKQGWNTLLFKVANADGGYALSARFADGKQLVVTPFNPFTPSGELTPARLFLDTTALDTRFVLTADSRPEFHLDIRLRNLGMANAEDVILATSLREKPVEVPTIHGGEIRDVSFELPFREAISAGSRGSHATISFQHGRREFTYLFPAAEMMLKALFLPWSLNGEGMSGVGTPGELFARTLVVPSELAGLGLKFSVDIGDAWGKVVINGRTTLARFSGDSGDLMLTEKAVPRDTARIEVAALESPPVPGQRAIHAALLPFNEPVQIYLDDVRFAREIYHMDPGDQSKIFQALFALLDAGQAEHAGEMLKEPMARLSALVPQDRRVSLHFVGNAHIDMAWLWRYPETIDVTRATLQSAVDNLKCDPNFKFSHGQAQSYLWVEERDPGLFREIQSFVKQGRWEIVGGTWVESDANMPSGESLVRQFLYGKRYFRKKFGVNAKHGWYPDTFGHAATLPDILAGCGNESYTFFRPEQPERMYDWQGPAGSVVLAHHPSNWYGTWAPVSDTIWKSAERTCKVLGVKDALQFYGVGDHGGGPTRRDIATIEHLSNLSMYPRVRFSTMQEYYQRIAATGPPMPVDRGEQNPVFEGCYTSQAMVKANNRKAEALLPTAEEVSVIAAQYGFQYPGAQLEDAWHRVLFNQFHDILCGSGVHAVYDDAKTFYDEAFRRADTALHGGLREIASRVNTRNKRRDAKPVLLFNPLNWKRVDPVILTVPVVAGKNTPWVYGDRGNRLDAQTIVATEDSVQFVFVPDSIPSVGYRTFWVRMEKPSPARAPGGALKQPHAFTLENRFYWVEIDPSTGAVSRIYDKVYKREVLPQAAQANQLTIQEDDAGMSAWVIGLKGEPHPINVPSSIQLVENGPVRQMVRIEYQYEESHFTQDIILYTSMPRIDFRVAADWRHRKRLVKVGFPLNLSRGTATFEIPYGSIIRPANGRETVAQKWVDVSTADYGVSLFNDSKYGFDVHDDTIHMTVLRAPTDPDPDADKGYHEFSYALYPHKGMWKQAGTVQRAYEFNTPVAAFWTDQHLGRLPSSLSFIQVNAAGVVLTTLKKAEDDKGLILRCYETLGEAERATLTCWLPMKEIRMMDMMEWEDEGKVSIGPTKRSARLDFGANEIKTWKILLASQ